MLNGATTKLRKAQARTASSEDEAEQAAGAFLVAWREPRAPVERCGGRVGEAHRAACFRPQPARSSRGGNWRRAHYVRARGSKSRSIRGSMSCSPPSRTASATLPSKAAEFISTGRRPTWSAGLDEEFSHPRRDNWALRPRSTPCSWRGAIVNPSEGRSATHVAEGGSGAPEDVDLATARRQRMRALVDAIEAGAFGDATGILHIGIGGSVLGPALVVDALGRLLVPRSGSSFLSKIDGAAFDEAVKTLDPATTLIVVASKSFTTLETVTKPRCGASVAARSWCRGSGKGG